MVAVLSAASAAVPLTTIGIGLEDGYGIIIKNGDVEGVADPLVGHGVIITRGVEVGVSNAVGVDEGYGTQ
jgi:hypothetical protein